MIPFRRRAFENQALVREIVARTFKSGEVCWGEVMPVQSSRAHAMTSKWPSLAVVIIYDEASQAAKNMFLELRDTMRTMWSNVHLVNKVDDAQKSICLLTKGVLSGTSLKKLARDVHIRDAKSREYVYVLEEDSKDEAWDWALPGKLHLPGEPEVESAIRSCIYSHEAYKWRGGSNEVLVYEHHAMIHDLTKKLVGDVGRSVARRISMMAKKKRKSRKNVGKKVEIDKEVKIEEEDEETDDDEEQQEILNMMDKKKRVKSNKVVPI